MLFHASLAASSCLPTVTRHFFLPATYPYTPYCAILFSILLCSPVPTGPHSPRHAVTHPAASPSVSFLHRFFILCYVTYVAYYFPVSVLFLCYVASLFFLSYTIFSSFVLSNLLPILFLRRFFLLDSFQLTILFLHQFFFLLYTTSSFPITVLLPLFY